QERRSCQSMRCIEAGAAAIGEEKLAGCATCLADALGKGERQEPRDRNGLTPSCPTKSARHLRPARRQFAHVAGATRSVTAETCQPMCKIDIVAAQPALDDHSSDLGSLLGVAELGCRNRHARKPGWQR